MLSGDRPTAIVAVEPRLLADAISRFLEQRGLQITPVPQPGRMVDLVVTDGDGDAPAARIVVTLPRQVGDRGSVSFVGSPVYGGVDGVADLDAVLRLLDT